jgi:L-fuculose-phosphate aldolase
MDIQRVREEIVEVGRRMYEHRLVVGLDGNVSARVSPERVLATPAGVCKGFLNPQDLILVDLDGRPVEGGRPSTELGMHLVIYRQRPDVDAVVHGHPPYATAFATAGIDLDRCLLPEIVVSLGEVPVTDYATPSTEEVGEAVRRVATDHDAFLLRNHGAVAVGRGVLSTYYKLETVEHLAHITFASEMLGGARALDQEQVAKLHAIRSVYGLDRPVPACRVAEEEAAGAAPETPPPSSDRLADVVAEEVARILRERS